ncbi:histidine phosphotransferase family protein [Novosphingobium resinovorum]|jgi:histidine phosphotransferase ChpT|uniref:histidine phosphotransferase family protein n=1 Tax=Novosphingobium TaxID=165696 RepID=UPI001B3C903E|nr:MULTISPECIES: histidine phosphotransferase family protein [Novosphingobium]MBF7012140.1 histidine phosphotransferase [Novosphingobium sp. HR1a]WJM26888.1 histidine phosphotransferase family protein [Novosphingobium resinovorum]
MTTSSIELASLLCSRLCHDMLSPVGALTNGLELLADEKDPEMRQRCFELLDQSARISTDKLKFFRLAFGAAGGFGEMVAVSEAKVLVDALVANNPRVTLAWALPSDSLPKAAIKTLLNFALIGLEALPRGGTLEIAAEYRDNHSELVVRAAGPRIAFDRSVGAALEGALPEGELSSRTAPAAMLRQLAVELKGQLQFALADDALVLGAMLPRA